MQYLLLTNEYPSEEKLYANAFIHSRVLAYKAKGINITVYVLNSRYKYFTYVFENVNVYVGNLNYLNNLYANNDFDKCLCHFINIEMMSFIMDKDIETVVWIHGFEALSWRRRLFNFKDIKFLGYIIKNIFQLKALKRFINQYNKATYIFVSNWMKETLEKDTGTTINRYYIIPNIINYDLFNYIEKNNEKRKNILSIRPFKGRKYANDITIKAILELSKKEIFKDLKITICGDGKDFDKLTKPLTKFSNIKLEKRFLKQHEIKEYHKENGVFLCPTRQDSQGVSMCEAMASGLVPITSNNTAIPEFVDNNTSGILTESVSDIVRAIEKIYYEEEYFNFLSKNAAKSIREKCDKDRILSKEIELIIK